MEIFNRMIRDLEIFPQDALAYCPAGQRETPLLWAEQQQLRLARLREHFFSPWTSSAAGNPDAVLGRFDKFARGEFFDRKLARMSPEYIQTLLERSELPGVLNTRGCGVVCSTTSLRELPARQAFYKDPSLPGEGPPFDALQCTTLWPGTPLTVEHVACGWAHVSSPLGDGWLPENDMVICDQKFMESWMQAPLAAVLTEHLNFFDYRKPFSLGVGTLLPQMERSPTLLDIAGPGQLPPHMERSIKKSESILARVFRLNLPVSGGGTAHALETTLPTHDAALLPLPMTPANLARLANQMLGQSYGWGGVDASGRPGLRDCSSTTHDLYAPFGLWLPRNSCDQALAGRVVPLAGLTAAQKEEKILREGVPWLTLLRSPGHIMIYVGSYQGRAAMMHSFWGVRTRTGEKETRHIVARCAITSLAPGAELPNILPGGTYLEMMESMVFLT